MVTSIMTKSFLQSIKFLLFLICFCFVLIMDVNSNEEAKFTEWLKSFKEYALKQGVSQQTLNLTLDNVKFLKQVIKYDRKQPEFIEPTNVYVKKRANQNRKKIAVSKYKKNKELIHNIENKFNVEKEILLSLWGIETNFGKHVGKMDILSSLATLSFDQRRSKFFTSELITLLKLVDSDVIKKESLYGSWAGAIGNFQFMPSTIKNYAIDYNNDGNIDLKNSLQDSMASAANYIKRIGWRYNEPCFIKVNINKDIDTKIVNYSARNIHSKKSLKKWFKLGVQKPENFNLATNMKAALISPDGKESLEFFLVFGNYEKILKWNRSLRFAISVCTLSTMIKNEI